MQIALKAKALLSPCLPLRRQMVRPCRKIHRWRPLRKP